MRTILAGHCVLFAQDHFILSYQEGLIQSSSPLSGVSSALDGAVDAVAAIGDSMVSNRNNFPLGLASSLLSHLLRAERVAWRVADYIARGARFGCLIKLAVGLSLLSERRSSCKLYTADAVCATGSCAHRQEINRNSVSSREIVKSWTKTPPILGHKTRRYSRRQFEKGMAC